jgi:acetyl esterase/lipase
MTAGSLTWGDAQATDANGSFLGTNVIPLWQGVTQPASDLVGPDGPSLTVFRPERNSENGSAVIVAPGGAYMMVSGNVEGRQVADWFASHGITAFVLKYRVGSAHPYPQPFEDAERAIRYVRSHAGEFNVNPERIGMIGFSAGGHLAALAASLGDEGKQDAADPLERVSSKLQFLILGYPGIDTMDSYDGKPSFYCGLYPMIPSSQCKSFEKTYGPMAHLSSQFPKTFIYQTSDDKYVRADRTTLFFNALHAQGVDTELHIFRHGAHGSGLGLGDPQLDLWPYLLEAWLRSEGLLTVDEAIARRRQLTATTPHQPGAPYTIDTQVSSILSNPAGREVLVKSLGQQTIDSMPPAAGTLSLRSLARMLPSVITPEKLSAIQSDLAALPVQGK